MTRGSKSATSSFRSNLQLLLRGRSITQVQFSNAIGAPKTTVNKWITSDSTPPADVMERIRDAYEVPFDLGTEDPDAFGAFLGLTQPEIDEVILAPSVFLRNVRVPKHDPILARLVGVYDLFMPSAIYKHKILQRTMRIYESANHRYYYEVFNLSEEVEDRVAPETRFSGSIVVSGEGEAGNMILLGGEARATAGVQFVAFQLPRRTRFKTMSGFILGEVDGSAFTNPVCARPIAEAEPESDIRDYAQPSVYVEDETFFGENPDILKVFRELVQNSWFSERIRHLP